MLGVSVETLRRWETEGRLRMERSEGGQRLIDDRRGQPAARRAPEGRRPTGRSSPSPPATASPGIVTRIEKDRVAAVVEVIAGPHRLVSLMTAEAVDELGLKVGDEAVCVVKATNVIVEVPSARESRAMRSRARRGHRDPGPRPRRLLERGAVAVGERGGLGGTRRSPRRLHASSRGRRRADDLRRGVAQGRARQGEGRLRGRQPRDRRSRSRPTRRRPSRRRSSRARPADVFLSADTTNPKKLVDKGLADGDAGRRSPATS